MNVIREKEITPEMVEKLAGSLREGGIGIWKTDTIYGFFCRYDADKSVKKISSLKGRAPEQKFSLAVEDFSILEPWFTLNAYQRELLDKTLPGPLTYILNVKEEYRGTRLGRGGTLGIRVPSHGLTLDLCEKTGVPLITTSANRSGKGNAVSLADIPGKDEVSFVIDSGKIADPLASTIVRLHEGGIEIMRKGAFPEKKLTEIWDSIAGSK
jgi:L-threonylcarbamoyladenylate synthase